MKKIFILIFGIILFVNLISATSVGTSDSDLTEGKVIYTTEPYSFDNNTGAVNSSVYANFWDFLDTPADIDHNLLNNLNWFDSGHIMDTDLDMNSNDIQEVNDLNVENDVYIADQLEVDGDVWIDEQLNVTGNVFIEKFGNLIFGGENNGGNITGVNNINVTGTSYLGDILVMNDNNINFSGGQINNVSMLGIGTAPSYPIHIVMSDSDTRAIDISESADFDGMGNAYVIEIDRTYGGTGTPSWSDYKYGIDMSANSEYIATGDVEWGRILWLRGVSGTSRFYGAHTMSSVNPPAIIERSRGLQFTGGRSGSTMTCDGYLGEHYGGYFYVEDSTRFDNADHDLISNLYGFMSKVDNTGESIHANSYEKNAIGVLAKVAQMPYGENVKAANIGVDIDVDGATFQVDSTNIGIRIDVDDDADTNYGIYILDTGTLTASIFDEGAGNWVIDNDNTALVLGEDQDVWQFWDGTNYNFYQTGNGVWTFLNSSGLGTIRVGDILYSTPEFSNDMSTLENMKDPKKIKSDGKTEKEFHKSFPTAVQVEFDIKDSDNCSEVYDYSIWSWYDTNNNESVEQRNEPAQIIKKRYDVSEEKRYKTECGTKKELGISGGKGYLDNYNLIYQLNQRIKYLEDNCIKK